MRTMEQVLYYGRSENTEKDYLIRETSLNDIIRNVIRKNKDSLLLRRIAIKFDASEAMVCTDAKWLEFIISQIVSNAIKYSKQEDAEIRFDISGGDQTVLLSIRDNGIGIASSDITRVFEHSLLEKTAGASAALQEWDFICAKAL